MKSNKSQDLEILWRFCQTLFLLRLNCVTKCVFLSDRRTIIVSYAINLYEKRHQHNYVVCLLNKNESWRIKDQLDVTCYFISLLMWWGWSGIRVAGWACNTDTTPTPPHRNSNTHRTKNNTTNMVIQQNSRKLLMMDILMSETCWAHKKWNKITSDIKLVFYSSTITMMHGPINIKLH